MKAHVYESDWNDKTSIWYGYVYREPPLDEPSREVLEVEMAGGSDYSGGFVTRSNYQVLQELCQENGWEYRPAYGALGTYSILLALPLPEELKELLRRLEDYPLLDEDHHSNLEMEAEREQWEDWGRDDFASALYKRLDKMKREVKRPLSNGALDKLYYQACELSGIYPFEDAPETFWFSSKERAEDAIEIIDSSLPPLSSWKREYLQGQRFLQLEDGSRGH